MAFLSKLKLSLVNVTVVQSYSNCNLFLPSLLLTSHGGPLMTVVFTGSKMCHHSSMYNYGLKIKFFKTMNKHLIIKVYKILEYSIWFYKQLLNYINEMSVNVSHLLKSVRQN